MSTKALRFQGGSDDTFGEYGRFGDDFDNCANGKPIVWMVRDAAGAGLLVWGQYAGRDWPDDAPGCWMVGIQQLAVDEPLPPWPLTWSAEGYSVVLEIDAPADATLVCLNAVEADES